MTRWKRESIARFGAADACLIHYRPLETPRGRAAACLTMAAGVRQRGHVPYATLMEIVKGTAARMVAQEACQ